MPQEKYANARHAGDSRFTVESGSGHHHFTLDGNGEAGPSPMDVVLAGLAGCTGIDVVSTLRKMRQDVTDLHVNVRGARAEDYPQVYTAITVEYIVTGHNLRADAVERAVELSETKYCSVGAMLGKTATITHAIRLIEAEPTTPTDVTAHADAAPITQPERA